MNSDQEGWPASEPPRGRHRATDPVPDQGPPPIFEPREDRYDAGYAGPPPAEVGPPPAEVTAPYGVGGGYWQAPDNGHPPAPYWQPPQAPGGVPWAPPPRRRRTGPIVALSIVAVVVLLGGLALIGVRSKWIPTAAKSPAVTPSPIPTSTVPATPTPSPTPEPRSLAIPKSFGDYTRVSDSASRSVVADMRRALIRDQRSKNARAAARKLKIGIYRISRITTPELFVIGFDASDSEFFAEELRENSPSTEVDFALMDMGVTHSKRYSPGTLGGALRCGRKSVRGVTGTVCAWADESVSATVLDFRITKPAVLAGVTRGLRGAAEH